MIIAIDDSGDVGFKLGKGSSPYFAIATVFFDDNLDAEEMALKIKRLRKNLNWTPLHEFKFRKTSDAIKEKFFKTINPLNFHIVLALIDKSTITDKTLIQNPSYFYNTVIIKTLNSGMRKIQKAHIYIDGESGSDYRRKTKTFFRQNLPKQAIKKLSYRDSKKDNLIQLADMIAGAAIYSTATNRDNAKNFLNIIKKHIITTITTP
jgi:hypothetical protein